MAHYTDVLIRCHSCSFTASEHEFATHDENAPLRCPKCGDESALYDVPENCDTCARAPVCTVKGDPVNYCKSWAC